MKRKILYGLGTVVLLFGGIFGWKYIQYLSNHIETDDAQVEGNIVPVLSRVGSYVARIYVVDNQPVTEGQLLVELDSSDLTLRLQQAAASYRSAVSTIQVSRSLVEDARVMEELAHTSIEAPKTNLWRAKNEYERYDDLFRQKLATPQKRDEVKADLENAGSQFDLAKQKYESAKVQHQTALHQLAVAEANAELRRKELGFAQLQLSYTKIYAPIAGVVSKKSIQSGQLIQAGQPMMALVQNSDIWVTANYKETQLQGMGIGNDVMIKVDAYPDLDFKGKVESIGGATGSKFSLIPPDNASGNFVKVVQRIGVRIALDPTPHLAELLKPGLSVQTSILKSR